MIDGATNRLTAQVTGIITPAAIAVDPLTDTVYAISGELAVINGATNTLTASFNLPPCSFPSAAMNPVTDMIYVTGCQAPGQSAIGGGMDVINGMTGGVVATIPVSLTGQYTTGVAVNTATNTIYVADPGDEQLAVIDGATNTVTRRFALPARSLPIGVAFDPSTGLVYTADELGSAVSVVDPATDTMSTLATGLTSAEGLAIDPGTGTLYVTSQAGHPYPALGTTYVIDAATGSIADQFNRGGQFVTVAVSGGPAYVSSVLGDLAVATPSSVNTMSPVIVGQRAFTFTVGLAGQGQLTASAAPSATFTASGLPAWLTLSPSGLLAGTPPAGSGGTYGPVVTASNGVAPPYSAVIGVTVDEAPTITSGNQVTFGTSAAASFTVTATGFPAPTFSESGPLPTGVTFTAAGLLYGAPAAGTAGVYPITITATNTAGAATQAFMLNVTAPAVAVGVQGTDGELWVQAPQLGSGWHPLGGVIVAPPAVAAPPNPDGAAPAAPLFIATGTDKHLYVRSLTAGWQQLDAATASCIGGPGAVITGTPASGYTVTVACRGTDNALWENSAPLPAFGLPTFPAAGWTSLGGVLSASPAVAPVGTTMTFFVRGTNGTIWARTTAAGYTATSWVCIGSPAAAQGPADGVTEFACQGTDRSLWQAASIGGGWSPAMSIGGVLIDGPGAAATTNETDFLAEGTDHSVWELTFFGWTSLGGSVVDGVGAAALN